MAGGSIKLFQFIERFCQLAGICVPQSNQNRNRLNAINWLVISFLVIFGVAVGAFLFYDAKTMFEYGFAFCVVVTALFECTAIYFISIWKVRDILKFTDNCERFIEKSE